MAASVPALPPGVLSLHVLPGAGHFFEDHLDALAQTVREVAA